MLWATQWHEVLQKYLNILADLKLRWFWTALAAIGIIIVVIFWTGRPQFKVAVAGSVFISGAIEMVLQMVFLLGFQIIEGFVYRQLALIIAFFMTGLAAGAGWVPPHERMWDTIVKHDPLAFLQLGDNVYIDNPTSTHQNRYCYYRRQSRPEFRKLVANTPVYSIWDDHDFTDDDGTGPGSPDAYTLEGASTVDGAYSAVGGAVITSSSPGVYQATATVAAGEQYFRISR